MTKSRIAPYGSWKSPVTSDLIVSEMIGLEQITLDGADIYWVEMHPKENGRYILVRRSPDGHTTEVTPPSFSVRTRVHEYGGGAYTVSGSMIYFSHFTDQRLYCQSPGSEPYPITPGGTLRYADGVIDDLRNCMICVREDHTDSESEPVNTLVRIQLDEGGPGEVVVSGNDFYSWPQLSPDRSFLAWLTWNHPNMPWDGTELWIGELTEKGSLVHREKVAGSSDESIFEPEWSPDGTLYFVSDRTGWWNLYCWRNRQVEPVCEMEAEFGVPQWAFRMSTYAFESKDRIICTYVEKGTWHIASLDTKTGKLEEIETPYTFIRNVRAAPGYCVFRGGSPTEPTSIVQLDVTSGNLKVLRRSGTVEIDPGYLSIPEALEYPTENGLTAHALFYRPKNRDYKAPDSERPPLLVISHGGPTDATSTRLNLMIQYWTSHGICVLDVNYGGSAGYGRKYRQRLDNQWGVVDVNDCINGAFYLVNRGEVDGNRLAIRGGSAGGYTTLCALTFKNVFKAGASYFGVSDLEALKKETHKFESHYLNRLVGPYPECRSLYEERSPIHHVEKLSCPIIFFQGLEDKVVLPNQAEMMVEAVREKGLPVAYVPFKDEQHGFRRSENIKRALDAELYFYAKIFGFELADPVEPVHIENL